MKRKAEVNVGNVLTLYVREGHGLLRPWWGTMSHGIFSVGDSGGGVWRARTRTRLIRKMAADAARMGFGFGAPDTVLIEVRDD